MNVAAVRKLTSPSPRARLLEEARAYADTQNCVTRCDKCSRWRYVGTVAAGKEAFARHLTSAMHTRRNQKRGPQAKTADRHAGRSWAK